MKVLMVAIVFCFCPLLGLAESVDAFPMGTADNPTIDGQFISEKKELNDGMIVQDDSTKSRLIPIDFSTHKVPDNLPLPQTNEKKWTESHVAQVLEKAAEGGKLSYVLNAAKRYDLPASVALIPIVESRYQPHAVSPKGAVGLWQLSKDVASDFDLPDSARTDWRASTEVALQHLSKLQAHYGRWDFVWAAYNAGQGRVDRAIKKHPEAHNALELDLPIETTHYVQSLLSLQSSLSTMEIAHA